MSNPFLLAILELLLVMIAAFCECPSLPGCTLLNNSLLLMFISDH